MNKTGNRKETTVGGGGCGVMDSNMPRVVGCTEAVQPALIPSQVFFSLLAAGKGLGLSTNTHLVDITLKVCVCMHAPGAPRVPRVSKHALLCTCSSGTTCCKGTPRKIELCFNSRASTATRMCLMLCGTLAGSLDSRHPRYAT